MYKYKCIYQKCCMELPAIIIIVVPMHSYFYFFSGGQKTTKCSLDLSSNIILEIQRCCVLLLDLQSKVREDFKITEKAPSRTFSWLQVPHGIMGRRFRD